MKKGDVLRAGEVVKVTAPGPFKGAAGTAVKVREKDADVHISGMVNGAAVNETRRYSLQNLGRVHG